MSAIVTNVPTNYYYGNMKLDSAPMNYRQQRYEAEVARQKAIENGVKFKRTTYNPHPTPPKTFWTDNGPKAVYDLVNDRIFPDMQSAAVALGVSSSTIKARAVQAKTIIFI